MDLDKKVEYLRGTGAQLRNKDGNIRLFSSSYVLYLLIFIKITAGLISGKFHRLNLLFLFSIAGENLPNCKY